MRIESLYMKNFALPFVALGKTEIFLDYTKLPNKVINIFVGKMGTCKTFLLGHHQPFATLGNLDVRNKEDMVLAEKKGVKKIVYKDGDTIFEITHYYNPSKNGHTVKSYIKKNGVELNENGNDSSFRQIIETEFALEQNFLKLFRIGSNVTNLPDMTSLERKNFVSSMLSDTDVYTMLYKKIGEENRSINAQMTMIINKLHNISKRSEEQLTADRDTEAVIVEEIRAEIADKTREVYRLEGMISALQDNMDTPSYQALYTRTKALLDSSMQSLAEVQSQLDSVKDHPDPTDVNVQIAKCHAQIEIRSQQLMDLQRKVDEDELQIHKLQDQLAVIGDETHIQTLRNTYEGLMGTLNEYEKKLARFTYQGSMGSIMSLMTEAENFDALIAEVSQYRKETIQELLRNKPRALNRAKREIDKAQRDKATVQQEMDNITHVSRYTPNHIMARPFNCPTPDCPYYKYHPVTERRNQTKINVDKVFLEMRQSLQQLEARIYIFDEYPNVSRKLDTIISIWKGLSKSLNDLGVLKEDDLEEIITNILHRQWYDSGRLAYIKELCGIREKYYELSQRVASMRNDLSQYENSDATSIQKGLRTINARYRENCEKIEMMEDANRADEATLKDLNEVYLRISNLEMLERRYDSILQQTESVRDDLANMEANLAAIAEYHTAMEKLGKEIADANLSFNVHSQTLEQLQRTLADLKLTKEQYAEVLKRQELVHDILDAVSSKKGIPLVFVKLFLDECKDDLNDLIAEVFEDSIEIKEFDIPEDGGEFNIPYLRSGVLIDDIIKSSQGERAVISLALSFALIRQASFKYNIMLLDEVDGPLHKDARNKFITILFKQLQAIAAEQVFIVSHNNTFDGFNVNIILTSDEVVDENPLTSVMNIAA